MRRLAAAERYSGFSNSQVLSVPFSTTVSLLKRVRTAVRTRKEQFDHRHSYPVFVSTQTSDSSPPFVSTQTSDSSPQEQFDHRTSYPIFDSTQTSDWSPPAPLFDMGGVPSENGECDSMVVDTPEPHAVPDAQARCDTQVRC